MRRIEAFDRMKGLAILAVVASHFSAITLGLRNSALAQACTIFMLPTFFVVSGYFSYKEGAASPASLKKTTKRCLTLLLPLVSWSVIETIAFSRPWDYYPTHGFAGLWFFWVLFLLTLVFSATECLLVWIKRSSVWIDIAVYGGIYLIFILIDRFCDTPGLLDAHQMVNYYRYYAIGIFLHKYSGIRNIALSINLMPVWLLLFCAEWYLFERQNTLLIFLGSIAGVIIVWHICGQMDGREGWLRKALAEIGCLTLPIYCVHWLFLPHDWNINGEYFKGIGAVMPQFAIAMGGVSVIVLLSIVTYKILSLNKWSRLILFGEFPKNHK